MFEPLVRPFETPNRTRARRIVTSVAGDEPTPAILTWGKAGAIPQGAPANDGEDLVGVGFKVSCCQDDWGQKSGDYEEIKHYATNEATGEIDKEHYILERRPTKLRFAKENNSCLGQPLFSWVAYKLDASFAEWDSKINPANCGSAYSFNYPS